MRVRSLQTYLTNQRLVHTSPLDELKGLRIGADSVYWLRTLPNVKDPLADAIGGLPPSVFGALDSNISLLTRHQIAMLFVFQGMQPKSHMLFSSQTLQQMDDAWRLVSEGEYVAAQHRFAQATSRINSDFLHAVSHYLQSNGIDVFQAPYFAAAQLAYFAQEGVVDAVFGPPAFLLFGIQRVIIGINLTKKEFDWVDRDYILKSWGVTEDQLLDACLLAGTEYCLTFPYLNLSQFHGGGSHFQFGTAVDFIKQAPLSGYMQHFPTEEMRADHVHGYCVCKCLVKYPLALHFDGSVRVVVRRRQAIASCEENKPEGEVQREGEDDQQQPAAKAESEKGCRSDANTEAEKTSSAADDDEAELKRFPDDLHKIIGVRLPNSIFLLMARNILSRKLPSVLALGEWSDLSPPTVDSVEYRDVLTEVQEYRRRAVGLIAMRLHPTFRERQIQFSRYICASPSHAANSHYVSAKCLPDCRPGMPWKFTVDELSAEVKRQNTDKISFRFCLNWHANEANHGRKLLAANSKSKADGYVGNCQVGLSSLEAIEATTYFMVLENLGYFTADGGVTVFGSALTSASPEFEEEVLTALELMKCGELMGEALEAAPDRPFPPSTSLLKRADNLFFQRSILLISRVCSLIPMNLTNTELWLAPVDFDLAAFHSIVKLLKRTFRHLSEACLANLLLQDLSATSLVPVTALGGASRSRRGFPSFMLPRNCTGIITKHFLEFLPAKRCRESGDPAEPGPSVEKLNRLEHELRRFYPCCKDPLLWLFTAFRFWNEVVQVIENLSQNIDVSVLKVDMDEANRYLLQRIAEVGVYLHPTFETPPFEQMRKSLEPFLAAANTTTTAATPNSTAGTEST